jgi:hypothetical protein
MWVDLVYAFLEVFTPNEPLVGSWKGFPLLVEWSMYVF